MNKSFKEKKKIATEIGFSAMIRLTPSSYWHAVPCFLFIVIVIRYYFFLLIFILFFFLSCPFSKSNGLHLNERQGVSSISFYVQKGRGHGGMRSSKWDQFQAWLLSETSSSSFCWSSTSCGSSCSSSSCSSCSCSSSSSSSSSSSTSSSCSSSSSFVTWLCRRTECYHWRKGWWWSWLN